MDTFYVISEEAQTLATKRSTLPEAEALAETMLRFDRPLFILQAVARLVPERTVVVERLSGVPLVRRPRKRAAMQQNPGGESVPSAVATVVAETTAGSSAAEQRPYKPQGDGATPSPPTPAATRWGRRPKAPLVAGGGVAAQPSAADTPADAGVRAERAGRCVHCRAGLPYLTDDRILHLQWNAGLSKHIEVPCEASG